MRNKQRYRGQLQNHVRIANFSGRSREITIPSKSSYFFMECDIHKHHKSHKKIDVMEDIDSVPSNVQSARQEALLYVF